MLTSKNKRNKKILLMALQCDSQINQNCHQQRKVLLKENTMNESNTITSITYKTNKQNTLFPVEEFLSDIQPFDELLPVTNNDNNNVNLTEVHVNEEPFVLPELIGDSFDTLEEISTHNLTELVPVSEGNKQTAIENPFVESPTFEQTIILECCVSTVNNVNDNVKLTNHTTTSQEILNNNTKVTEEPTILLDNINDSFEKIEPREKMLQNRNKDPSISK